MNKIIVWVAALLSCASIAQPNPISAAHILYIPANHVVAFSSYAIQIKQCDNCQVEQLKLSEKTELYEKSTTINISEATEVYVKRNFDIAVIVVNENTLSVERIHFGHEPEVPLMTVHSTSNK